MPDEIALNPDLKRGLDYLEAAYRNGTLDVEAKTAVVDFIQRELRIRGAETRALEALRANPTNTVKVEFTRDELRVLHDRFERGHKAEGAQWRPWVEYGTEATIRTKLHAAELAVKPTETQEQSLRPSRGLRM